MEKDAKLNPKNDDIILQKLSALLREITYLQYWDINNSYGSAIVLSGLKIV